MTEQRIQSKRIKELESEGYFVLKLIRTNKNGIPDLLAIPKNSDVLFSEIKKPEGKLTKLQQYRIKELESYGIKTEVYRGDDNAAGGQSKRDSGTDDVRKYKKQKKNS